MAEFWNNLPGIISALAVIITAYFTYNQYTKNKETDRKIEKIKPEEAKKSKRRSDNSGIVYGELYEVLRDLGADRVYIVQPHPLGNEEKLSIYYEVKRKGIEPMKPVIQNLPIAEVAKFNRSLIENLFMYITDIDHQIDDKYTKAIMSSHGCQGVIIKRLSDNRHDRNGSIFAEFTRPIDIKQEAAQEIMHDAAMNIQYILPEITE